jgi:hypothetical protein
MALPTATIVIPCFNHGRFVREAVDSCLTQIDADVRVVVVNDGSDDGTTAAQCDAVAGERVRVIHQPNAGLPAARNRGAREADGEFIAFLDADDWIEPEFVTKLAKAIHEADDPSVSHAYCQEQLVELGQGIWRVPEWDAELMLITNLHPVTALIRRDYFEQLGGFDQTMTRGYEDWELWIRCVARGWRGVRVPEPLFIWRRHAQVTMVMEAVQRHDELVGSIIERHRELYEQHFEALYLRCNSMLRRFDCNWIDETGDPIPLRHLREAAAMVPHLHQQLGVLTHERDAWRAHAENLERGAQQLHADYEKMTVIRLHHRLHALRRSMRRAMPKPLHWLLDLPVRVARRLAGRRP